MIFTPLSEQQIRDNTFLPTGTYAFTVRSATERLMPGGPAIIDLVLVVSRGGGDKRTYTVKDSLSSTKMQKLREAAFTCGLVAHYNRGQLCANDFASKTGYAKILLNPPRGEYPEKNVVASYVAQGLMR